MVARGRDFSAFNRAADTVWSAGDCKRKFAAASNRSEAAYRGMAIIRLPPPTKVVTVTVTLHTRTCRPQEASPTLLRHGQHPQQRAIPHRNKANLALLLVNPDGKFPAGGHQEREKAMNTARQSALLLGWLTLARWIAGGLAVDWEKAQLVHRQRAAENLTFGLSAAGFISAVSTAAIPVIR
ncbi:hypothetical protein [Rhizobium sophoriradicis]|nr:hypothetical protein [Rhizobium sophoriradicis]